MKMKFIKSYPIIVAVLGTVLVSCSEEVTSDIFGHRTPIEIKASVTSQEEGETRSSTNLNTNVGFTLSETATYNKVNVNIDGDDYAYSITGEGGIGTGLDIDVAKPYFPVGETSVDVYGRYPDYADDVEKDGATTYFTIQQDQTTADAYLRSDLMTAAGTATRSLQSNGNWNVTEANLEFHHQMTKVVVNASSEDENIITIKQVVLNGVKPTVPLTIGTGGYEVGDATGTACDVKVLGAFTGTGESAVIIPAQTIAPEGAATQRTFLTITIDFKNPYNNFESEELNLCYYLTGTGKTFAANKVYTMNVIVGIDNIVLYDGESTANAVDISEWNDVNATTINIFPTVVHTSLRMEGRIQLKQGDNVVESISKVYTGSMVTLSSNELVVQVQVRDENEVVTGWSNPLVINQDYVTTYENNVNASTATNKAKVTVVGIGQYSGTLTAEFEITKRPFSNVTIADIPAETYDGYVHRPAVSVTETIGDVTKTLFLDTDFTLTYPEDLTTAGTKTITIIPINNYGGTAITKDFVINKATGSFTIADNAVRYYVPTGKTQTYTNKVTITKGDPDVTITGTPNSGTVRVGSGGVVTMEPSSNGTSTQTVTISVSSQNYTYPSQSFTLTMKSGPILPIMYVAPYNMGDLKNNSHAMAENNWTAFSSFYSWNPEKFGNYDMKSLKKNGLTKDGIHYHLPSYNEWLSIVSAGVSWSTTKTTVSDSEVKFRVTPGRTTETDDTDYSYGVTGTSSWSSDYIRTENSDGTYTDYGLRFKGSSYVCAYRYDMMTTTASNSSWTGNSNGSISMVIRVIYLGSGSTYTVSTIKNLDWEHGTDYSIALPFCGYQTFADNAGACYYQSVTGGWNGRYYSATCTSSSSYKYLYINPQGNMTYDTGFSNGYSVRLFRDAY